jgi:hypothetical protein
MRCELGQLCSSLRLKTLQAAKAYSRVQTGSFRPGHDSINEKKMRYICILGFCLIYIFSEYYQGMM